MNDRLFELEIKKILQEYKLLLIDEEYIEELISLNKKNFLKEISDKNGFPDPPDVDEKESNRNDEVDDDPENNEIDEKESNISDEVDEPENNEIDEKESTIRLSIKKLYRSIVKLTHPDKTMHKNNRKELSDLYIRAKKAMASMDVYEILTICDRLGIEYQIDFNQKDILEENLKSKKEKIKSLENSFIWLWIKATNDIDKDKIVDLFIKTHKK